MGRISWTELAVYPNDRSDRTVALHLGPDPRHMPHAPHRLTLPFVEGEAEVLDKEYET